jgi:hypothetical protein
VSQNARHSADRRLSNPESFSKYPLGVRTLESNHVERQKARVGEPRLLAKNLIPGAVEPRGERMKGPAEVKLFHFQYLSTLS